MSLEDYRQKRDFKRTPEPTGGKHGHGLIFVVQKHAASHLHYDFRLEHGGVLWSWAVPKGPCLDPAEKRLAVQVEDHPLDYQDFEGLIPAGEYGGGTVMVWDRGLWQPQGDPEADYRAGKLKFILEGEKLRGAWTLIRMHPRKGSSGGKPQWLLIKEKDGEVRPLSEYDIQQEEANSVKTGRTLDEITAGKAPHRRTKVKAATPAKKAVKAKKAAAAKKGSGVKKAAKRQRQPKRGSAKYVSRRTRAPDDQWDPASLTGARESKIPATVDVQLATLVTEAPVGDAWLHEIKFDGYRMLCRIQESAASEKQIQFISRANRPWTKLFPDLLKTAAQLPVKEAILDGEVVVLDEQGISSFQILQNSLKHGQQSSPFVFYVFDLLYLDGYDLRPAPLWERKQLLKSLLEAANIDTWRFSDDISGEGAEIRQAACGAGLEGIISKRRNAPYRAGRGTDWVKSKCRQGQELVIGGYTKANGSRTEFGALLLGYHRPDGSLAYAGRCGTGFSVATLRDLSARMRPLKQDHTPFTKLPPGAGNGWVQWLKPELVAQVEFNNWTDDGILRQAAFLGLREDKPASAIVRELPRSTTAVTGTPSNGESMPKASKNSKKDQEIGIPDGFRLTHPERVIFPADGITKGELAEYYAHVADWMLPHLGNRPLALVRCPAGIDGQRFFQKHPPDGMSDVVQRVPIQEKHELDTYMAVNDKEGLLTLIQFGAVEIHLWGSRVDDVERPDRLVFDIDPDPSVAWKDVVNSAVIVRDLLKELGLQSFVKTSGGKGLHVVVPIQRRLEWPAVKAFCKSVATLLESVAPDQFLANMSKAARKGKIFIDYLRNDRGSTAIAPYSTRARAGAPVATPLTWDELKKLDGPQQFTLKNVPERLARLKRDPWALMDTLNQSITPDAIESLKNASGPPAAGTTQRKATKSRATAKR